MGEQCGDCGSSIIKCGGHGIQCGVCGSHNLIQAPPTESDTSGGEPDITCQICGAPTAHIYKQYRCETHARPPEPDARLREALEEIKALEPILSLPHDRQVWVRILNKMWEIAHNALNKEKKNELDTPTTEEEEPGYGHGV